MKRLIPVMMMATVPMMGMAQNQSGLIEKNFDRNVRPQDDFYEFATGGWQKNHPLPAAYSRFGSFDQLQEDNNKRINTILGELQKKKYKKGTIEQKLSDFYKQALDVTSRNKAGISPVKPLLDEIEEAKDVASLRQLQLKYATQGYGQQFASFFDADQKNVAMNILNLYQSGLTLGQKDYYLNNDAATVAIRDAYKKHIVRMFELYGFDKDEAQKRAEKVFKQETMVALISKSMTELRDPQANYNKMSLSEFEANYPNIPLKSLTQAEGIKTEYINEMVVGQPQFFTGLNALLGLQTTDDIKALMEWDVISGSSSYLTDEIREANFDFFGKTMSGRKEDYPLWKRATSQVESQMGEA
jgi:putative endopeptidase